MFIQPTKDMSVFFSEIPKKITLVSCLSLLEIAGRIEPTQFSLSLGCFSSSVLFAIFSSQSWGGCGERDVPSVVTLCVTILWSSTPLFFAVEKSLSLFLFAFFILNYASCGGVGLRYLMKKVISDKFKPTVLIFGQSVVA